MKTYEGKEPATCGNCEYYRYDFFHQFGDSFGGCIKHPDGELEPEAPACPDWEPIKDD
jgi:hypothetical protein